MTVKTITDEPSGGFVVWFDPNGDPYAVFHKNDGDHGQGDDVWFNADRYGMPFTDPLTWADLCAEMKGFKGPFRLVLDGAE